ncbi:MAG: dipeptidase [Longimicrobiales bacterium]|nr:dipeptidase [Longimicrobiales bacterium]
MRAAAVMLLSALLATGAAGQDAHLARARAVLATTPLVDGHNDLPWAIREHPTAPRDVEAYDLRDRTPGHTDLDRLRAGGVGAQFWSVYVPCDAVAEGAARVQLEQIDIARRVVRRYPDAFGEALSASDVEREFARGRIASLLGMEGGHAIENSLGALRAFYAAGVRYMTLTHGCNTDWADSATDEPRHGGLTAFGREVVREMNRMGMLVDLSHTSPAAMHAALDVAEAPVIFSHSSARAVTDHPRNVPDDVLRRLPENGGLVMVTFVPSFVSDAVRTWEGPPEAAPRATLSDVADHVEHIRTVAGVAHVGLGGDFDGISSVVEGLEDVSTYPALLAELARRGWSDAELRQLAGENALRVMREAEAAARRLQRERAPSTATLEALDGPAAGAEAERAEAERAEAERAGAERAGKGDA